MGLRLTAMLAMAGAITGFFVSLTAPPRYIGSTTLRFIRSGVSQAEYEARARRVSASVAFPVVTDESLAAMIQRESILTEMVPLYAGDELKDLLRGSVDIKPVNLPNGALGFSVTYQDNDPERALGIDSVFSRTLARFAASENPAGNNREFTEVAVAPHTQPSNAAVALDSAIGFASGSLIGLLVWAIHGLTSARRPKHSGRA